MCLICDRIKMIKEDRNPYFVKELKTGYVVIGDHQHFKGYTLFLCKKHKTELFQLEDKVKIQFLEEMSLVAEAVSSAFGAEKMNYELLGNGDTHLHWHLFPRIAGDLEQYGSNGKGPVAGQGRHHLLLHLPRCDDGKGIGAFHIDAPGVDGPGVEVFALAVHADPVAEI